MSFRIVLISTFLILVSGCATNETSKHDAFIKSIQDRYSLGLIHQDYNHEKNPYKYGAITGGVVVVKISTKSETYKSRLKTGWVLLSVDGVSLENDGQNKLFNRLQDKSKSDKLTFKAFTGEIETEITLTRAKTKSIYPLNSYVKVL